MRPSRLSPSRLLGLVLGSTLVLFGATAAGANDDCPPGSVHKTQDSFGWCEPTICATDGQCSPNEVCRPIGLCMEVGTLADAATADSGQKLVVTQRCAPDKTCPQRQTCSDLGRCISKAAAEKMGILTASAASGTAAPPAEAKKSSCGCEAIGATPARSSVGALIALVLSLVVLRRRRAADPT